MAAPRWKALARMIEAPDSPQWDYSADGIEVTRRFHGPYAVVAASVPVRGTAMAGYPLNLRIDQATIGKSPGAVGRLTLIARAPAADTTETAPSDPVVEIDWGQLEKPLVLNPAFVSLVGPSVAEQLALAEEYLTASASRRTAIWAKLSAVAGAQKYIAKRLAGVESYIIAAPVLRYTQQHFKQPPAVTEVGLTWTPNQIKAVIGNVQIPRKAASQYQWLMTSDRQNRTGKAGKWERVREWTGADSWDSDLYEAKA